jgi:hypothetical protein
VYSWRSPELCGRTNNFAGQEIEVDTPTASGQAASKGYVDNVASNITPAQWAQYPAAADVRVAGKRLTWETYSLLSNGTLAAVSYTVASSQNWFRVQHSGWDLLRISASNNLLAITNFVIDASNYLNMAVWTQDLVTAPWPEYTTNLVDGYWTRVTAWTSVTNGDDSVNLRFTNDWTGAAFFRALCLATNETVTELLTDKTTARKLEVESATLGGVNRTNWPASGGTSGAEVTNIVGDVNSTGTVYNASNLDGVAAASYVTNGGATINGQAISNGAAITIPTNAAPVEWAIFTMTNSSVTAAHLAYVSLPLTATTTNTSLCSLSDGSVVIGKNGVYEISSCYYYHTAKSALFQQYIYVKTGSTTNQMLVHSESIYNGAAAEGSTGIMYKHVALTTNQTLSFVGRYILSGESMLIRGDAYSPGATYLELKYEGP